MKFGNCLLECAGLPAPTRERGRLAQCHLLFLKWCVRTKLPRSGCVLKPRVGRAFCGQPWGSEDYMSTLKGLIFLRKSRTQPPRGRYCIAMTQGWRQTAPPTLGFVTQPFQGKKRKSKWHWASRRHRQSNSNGCGLYCRFWGQQR